MSLTHKLHWRYAVRIFDEQKKVPEEDITALLESIRLAPSALGLQPYDILVIHNKKLQKNLVSASSDQIQVAEASHLIVFAAHTSINDQYIDSYLEQTAEARNIDIDELNQLKKLIYSVTEKKKQEKNFMEWATRQIYLAMGILLLAAADRQIDICPLELIDGEAYDRILSLDPSLHTVLVAAVGYRSQKDKLAYKKKSRRNLRDMIHLYYN